MDKQTYQQAVVASLYAAENSFSSLTLHLEDLSPQHSKVPDVHNPLLEAVHILRVFRIGSTQ